MYFIGAVVLQGNHVTLDIIVLASGFISGISVVECEKEALKEKAINFTNELVFNRISGNVRQNGRIKILFVIDHTTKPAVKIAGTFTDAERLIIDADFIRFNVPLAIKFAIPARFICTCRL